VSLAEIIGGVLLVVGSVFCVIGGVGVVRMPTFYSRIHAAGVTDTFGAGFVLLGLVLFAGFSQAAIKLVLVFIFMVITGPTASHALAKSAFAQGFAFRPPGHEGQEERVDVSD
jgi:multicomponent Na+:H+ antiporter subunit G